MTKRLKCETLVRNGLGKCLRVGWNPQFRSCLERSNEGMVAPTKLSLEHSILSYTEWRGVNSHVGGDQ